jgi:hypothetical protein
MGIGSRRAARKLGVRKVDGLGVRLHKGIVVGFAVGGFRPGVGRLAGVLLLLLASCSGGGGESLTDTSSPPDPGDSFVNEFQIGDVVAEFELGAPSVDEFFLRGTLPMPKGLYPLDTVTSPFSVRDQDGSVVDTQVEVVSRYPNLDDGADVIEIIASVERPDGVSSGTRITYEVLWRSSTAVTHTVDPEIETMLNEEDSIVLRTTDVFGHSYEADLLNDIRVNDPLDLKIKRAGGYVQQFRTYENLEPVTPVQGATGTLPHLMGVHSYVTTWKDAGFISIDLRVHNGHEGKDSGTVDDDPMGKVYFNELELVVPDGWTLFQAFETPTFGTKYSEGLTDVYPIVTQIGGGQLHVMQIQNQFHRRLVLCKTGWRQRAQTVLEEENLGICRDGMNASDFRLLSWWNPVSARYWSQNLPLPVLEPLESPADSRSQLLSDFAGMNSALTNGSTGPWPITYSAQGWAHPWGPHSGGFQGGAEIYFWDGVRTAWGASNEGYRLFQITHRMYTERHPTALYDLHGEPYNLESWSYAGPDGPVLPNWMFIIPWLPLGDPHGFLTAPTFQVDAVVNQGRQPDYEANLADFAYVDAEHLIRYTRAPKVLAWLGNDAIAKDDLQLQAELSRATYSIRPQDVTGQCVSTGMLWDRIFVDEHMNEGFNLNRAEGWMFDTAASYYSLADPAWRDQARYWFDDIVDLLEDGRSSCSGTIMVKPNTAHFGGQYRLVQSISECILQNGLWGVRKSVYDGANSAQVTRINNILKSSTAAMISDQVWSYADNSPHFYTALGPYDVEQPAFCGYVPPGGNEGDDGWQTWNIYVFGYLITGQNQYLNKATLQAGGTLTPTTVLSNGATGKLETRAGLISMLQNML